MEPTLHRLPRLPHARTALAVLVALLVPVSLLAAGLLSPPGAGRGYAAAVTPPPPPTYVPTVIPPPPSPPSPTPTAAPPTATPTSTSSAATTPTTTATTGPTPTAVVTSRFSLDAARVSKLHNPGDLSGLAAVRAGSEVWLMIYYTLTSVTHRTSRVATYDVLAGQRLLYDIVFRDSVKAGTAGRVVKYTVYHLPATLPFGQYRFRASLTIGGHKQTKQWKFRVAAHDHVVYHTGND